MSITSSQGIKSIQRGIIIIPAAAGSQTATITAVDMNKATLGNLGVQWDSGAGSGDARLAFTSATQLTATKTNSSSGQSTVGWEVIEWW